MKTALFTLALLSGLAFFNVSRAEACDCGKGKPCTCKTECHCPDCSCPQCPGKKN